MCYGQEDEKCETGLIEAMAKSSTTSAAKIISFPITLLLTLSLFAQILVFGCLPDLEPYNGRQGRSRMLSKENDIRVNVNKVYSLNRQGETVSVRPNFSARSGQSIYGRLSVPWSSTEIWTLEVLAHWSDYYPSTPLWLYIKRNGLPSTTNFDKTGVSFTSRQFSRIRIHEAEPGGNYFVMVEAMQNIRNLTLEMKLIDTSQQEVQIESMRSSFAWPRRQVTVP